ncbi:hypothetical protein C7475_10462 [Chitinophaga sp. S165]|nr:hypothetical protein C7475_10462 [Chitinophaga sp. S165]
MSYIRRIRDASLKLTYQNDLSRKVWQVEFFRLLYSPDVQAGKLPELPGTKKENIPRYSPEDVSLISL